MYIYSQHKPKKCIQLVQAQYCLFFLVHLFVLSYLFISIYIFYLLLFCFLMVFSQTHAWISTKPTTVGNCTYCCIYIFFSIWVFFHKHSQITGLQGKGESISLTPHYCFHLLHRHLDISWVITAASSPLHIASIAEYFTQGKLNIQQIIA